MSVRYPKETKGYYFYLTEEQKVFISNRIIFSKKKFLGEKTNASKIELSEVHEVEEPAHTKSDSIGESNPEPVEVLLKRSDRVLHQPDRYYGFLIQNSVPIELDEHDEDPITYMEAMQRSDFQKWLEVMKSEIESMIINSVWTLVDTLNPWGASRFSKEKEKRTERWRPIKSI